jgi:hypothetical protein
MPEAVRVSRRLRPAVFGRAYPYRGTLEADLLNEIGDSYPGAKPWRRGETGMA